MPKQAKNLKSSIPARRLCEFVVLVAGCLAFGYVSSSCSKPENKIEIVQTETAAPAETPEFPLVPAINPNADFSKFKHSNAEHARFPCALCHERTDNAATPKLSGHLPCAGCHTAQFADNKNAICTICHTDAEGGTVKAFPALKTFNVVFDHAKHQRQTDCATCHKPLGSGGLSIPTGLNAHNSCFQCHSATAEQNLSSCGTCHQPGRKVNARSESAKIFAVFKHAAHKLGCATCHTVKAGAARGNQVNSPRPLMHYAPKNSLSCGGCHNNQRAFGGTDFADCKRCHRENKYQF